MREKYESLALTELKEIAKARGLKKISALRKAELIELMLSEDEKDKEAGKDVEPKPVLKRRTVKTKEEKEIKEVKESKENTKPDQEEKPPVEKTSTEKIPTDKTFTEKKTPDKSEEKQSSEKPTVEKAYSEKNYSERTYSYTPYQEIPTYEKNSENKFPAELDSGVTAKGILEVMPDGFGFIRSDNFLPGENDVYVAPSQIRRFGLRTGDIIEGNTRVKTMNEKFSALLYLKKINGYPPEIASKRRKFEDMTPIFPNSRIKLETPNSSVAMRIMDLMSPVGKGQRGMIVSPPKAGKTTLLKEVAKSVLKNAPEMHMIILLIDERPEEVTDIKEAIQGPNVEVIYSTFDELPEHHKRVSEMVIERAKRLVEHRKDVCILLDSITRLTRAYNLTVPPSGRTLSGGLDPAALHMPKRFFGAARNMREGGSLTILATALVETGSKMDDVVYEEFKGTGNMEMVLDRKLSEKRVFPAIDIPKSGTRREDLLLTQDELDAINNMRRAINGIKSDEAVEKILDMFARTRNNNEFVEIVKKMKFI
jgi:transcription termination factor Rho